MRQLRALGFPIPEGRLWDSVASVRWPGRLWAAPGLEGVWMDGAHNPEGAKVLADHALACGLQPHLFFGAMGDKDLEGIAAQLRRTHPRSVTFIRGGAPRYAEREALARAWGLDAPLLTLREAATRLRAPADGPRLVTGSLYLIGDLLRELGIRLA